MPKQVQHSWPPSRLCCLTCLIYRGLTVGRVLVGIGIGVSAVVVPAYLGEVAPANVRGRIVEVYEVMLCCGVLMAMLVDAALQSVVYNWRWMVGAPVIPALFLAGKWATRFVTLPLSVWELDSRDKFPTSSPEMS